MRQKTRVPAGHAEVIREGPAAFGAADVEAVAGQRHGFPVGTITAQDDESTAESARPPLFPHWGRLRRSGNDGTGRGNGSLGRSVHPRPAVLAEGKAGRGWLIADRAANASGCPGGGCPRGGSPHGDRRDGGSGRKGCADRTSIRRQAGRIAMHLHFARTRRSRIERLAAVLTEERAIPIGSPTVSTPCHRQVNLSASLIYN